MAAKRKDNTDYGMPIRRVSSDELDAIRSRPATPGLWAQDLGGFFEPGATEQEVKPFVKTAYIASMPREPRRGR